MYRCACGARVAPSESALGAVKCSECQRLEALKVVDMLKARRKLETDILALIAAFNSFSTLIVEDVKLDYTETMTEGLKLRGVHVEVKL